MSKLETGYRRNIYQIIKDPKVLRHRFPLQQGVPIEKLKITQEGLYSITRPEDAEMMSQIMKNYLGDLSNLVITDATANVGGNVINFAKHFKAVQAIEWSSVTCDVLEHNLKTYGIDNVDVYNEDYTKLFPALLQDVIYIDPPWGGCGYSQKNSMYLDLSTYTISELVNRIKGMAKLIMIKVPENFDFNRFLKEQNFNTVHWYRVYNYRILVLL